MTAAPGAGRSAPLDGVRALAVVAVLAYHAHYPWAVGGYLGVDVFFVLSGYLITQVLLRTRRSWSGYRDFLVRRAVRLFPALLAATLGVAALVLLVGTTRERHALLPCSASALGYLMNLSLADDLSCPALWHVTWSLASEQQFYLVWPLVLAGLLVVGRRAWGSRSGLLATASAAGALYALSLGWQVVQRRRGGVPTWRLAYAPDGRSLVLLLGCMLALLLAHPGALRGLERAASAVGLAAVGVLAWCVVTGDLGAELSDLRPFVVAGLASLALVWSAAHAPEGSALARALGARPVAWLGRVSYSLYLWHEVAYRLAELVAPRGSLLAEVLRFVLALALAASSYTWVELPAQRWWRDRQRTVARERVGRELVGVA